MREIQTTLCECAVHVSARVCVFVCAHVRACVRTDWKREEERQESVDAFLIISRLDCCLSDS